MAVDYQLRADAEWATVLRDRAAKQWRRGWEDHDRWTQEYRDTLDAMYALLRPFWDRYDALPQEIHRGDHAAIETGVRYLETAPRCWGSGYIAEAVMRRLSRARLTDEQRERLRGVVLAETEHRQTRGWRDVGAPAGALWNDDLAARLSAIAKGGGRVGHRADRMAAAALLWRRSSRCESAPD